MLDRISIDNFATIEHVSFDLGSGLNIITGETGAGKSVLVEAISTALGGRADISMVRTGTNKSVIQILGTRDGEDVLISRELMSNGKSICKLNGELTTLAALRAYCSGLVDIHGQYDNQQILDPENHITITDSFRHDRIAADLELLQELCASYREARSAYDKLLARESETLRQQEFYRFEYDNITSLGLKSGEEESLRSDFDMMRNSERIYSAVNGAYELLHESDSAVVPALGSCSDALVSVSGYSDDLHEVSDELADLYYRLEDVSAQLRSMRDRFTFSEQDMDEVSARLSVIEEAKRKYRKSVEEIIEYCAELEERLAVIDNYDDAKADAKAAMDQAYMKLSDQADKVSSIRKENAAVLAAAIRQELADLEFSNTGFEVSIKKADEIGPLGYDIVEFLISTNPGEPLRPLTRIASGGEISRIMLAFKRIIGDGDKLDTMIFDEIDTGISGKTALVVGRKLLDIAAHHQVICITHLPQIAAYGEDNYLISKAVVGGKSSTSVEHLDREGKTRTIANLISGDPDDESSLKAARELIAKIRP